MNISHVLFCSRERFIIYCRGKNPQIYIYRSQLSLVYSKIRSQLMFIVFLVSLVFDYYKLSVDIYLVLITKELNVWKLD